MGFGSTVVTQVVVSVNSLNGLSGLGHSMYFGDYSYGKLQLSDRSAFVHIQSIHLMELLVY